MDWSKLGSSMMESAMKQSKQMEASLKRKLRSMSDDEVRRTLNTCKPGVYDMVEEEARRRGIR